MVTNHILLLSAHEMLPALARGSYRDGHSRAYQHCVCRLLIHGVGGVVQIDGRVRGVSRDAMMSFLSSSESCIDFAASDKGQNTILAFVGRPKRQQVHIEPTGLARCFSEG